MRLNPNTLCDFLVLDKTPDEYGEPSNQWTPSVEGVFCEVTPILGRDFIQAMTSGSTVEVKIRARWIAGIRDEMRVRCDDGTMYDIISAINVNGNNRELLCYCRKVRT